MFDFSENICYNIVKAPAPMPKQIKRMSRKDDISTMNYYEWSMEYSAQADKLYDVINKLKAKYKRASKSEKKQLESRIREYRSCYRECVEISNHLMERHRGAA